jgi:hypothetical protein
MTNDSRLRASTARLSDHHARLGWRFEAVVARLASPAYHHGPAAGQKERLTGDQRRHRIGSGSSRRVNRAFPRGPALGGPGLRTHQHHAPELLTADRCPDDRPYRSAFPQQPGINMLCKFVIAARQAGAALSVRAPELAWPSSPISKTVPRAAPRDRLADAGLSPFSDAGAGGRRAHVGRNDMIDTAQGCPLFAGFQRTTCRSSPMPEWSGGAAHEVVFCER